MLRFEWQAFVTPALLQQLADASGAPLLAVQAMALRLARLFEHVGGLPFVADEPSADARTARGLQWLDEALGHALAEAGLRRATDGLVSAPRNAAPTVCAEMFDAVPLVEANHAAADEWRRLPGITAALAQAIVVEREAHGAFTGLADFERRVDGIGPVRARALADALSFAAPSLPRVEPAAHDTWAGRLRTLMRLQAQAALPEAALAGALNQLLASVASRPHPASRDALLRDASPAPAGDAGAAVQAQFVGELWGRSYWAALPALMARAAQSIELCMFHVAAPNPKHPTYPLLQGLVQAQQRGVAVRAIVDRDGKTDPYHSTLINSAARRFLSDSGVACRSDSSARLLHSKYLVFDRSLVVLGSHNWSAGSYFRFDDLTLAVQSPPLAAQLLARFDALWATAS